MAVTTTGSLVKGTVQGLPGHLGANPGMVMNLIDGNPNGVLTSPNVSGLAFDNGNSELYMALVAGGSTWVKLGSVSA